MIKLSGVRSKSRVAALPRRGVTWWWPVAAVFVLMVTLVSNPVPASAAGPWITEATNVRSCTNLGNGVCGPFTVFGGGTGVTMVCWRDELWATGAYRSNRWFLVHRIGDGLEGFVHSSLVAGQVGTPNCDSVPRVRAGLAAIARVGQVSASPTDAARFTDWAPGEYGEWSGDCKKLVSVAWRDAGVPLIGGNAKPTFDTYWANRAWRGGGNPAYGALVGWNTALPYGHIGVAIGGTRVVATRGWDNQRLPVSVTSTGSYPGYAGWVVP